MKTSFISSLAMQNSMRSTILKAQLEMTNLNTELTTGKHADLGVTLGANTARSLDLNRDVDRLSSLVSVNSIATQRLKSSQAALDGMAKAAQEIQKVLVPNTSSAAPTLATVAKTISNAFNTFTGFANTAVSGEFLFSGINTDVKPIDDYFAEGSTLKAAYEVELNAFMAAQTPAVGNIADLSKDQAAAFMTRIEGVFNGTTPVTNPPHSDLTAGQNYDFWTTYGSKASDTNMTSRISQNEVVETSTNSNSQGMRYFAMTAMTAMTFLDDKVPSDVRELVATRSVTNIGTVISGLNQQQSQLGLSESRVSKANDSLAAQKKIIETHLLDIEGIDTYEVKTRLDLLQQQIEIAYSLTSRLQKMSLVNYL
ncbi:MULTISPECIES: flagellar hook-associated family protein [Rhizobium/Agrobacterium group]|jgi:flagellar hook-associated protein 3 FlgL|uniref:Flagellin n=2 Tax=Rhizobium/Agrobacterium group TaxID=227290 RepID=A0A1V2APA7_AGRTU|nr:MULTISPECIES: flagellar hook-associated family protein [Rhizobium/Agrobacterium group]AHK00437.1 flagellar hook-associated protein FlgL [Agrobacterium tumefaciens LBA4213 (Ach5)]AKC06280.1 flagellar hook-associated protein 3 FlgL [Agrobacterium tumefaciens]EHJ98364.1 flagellar hook-associated protein FlgL [Agrobacterium tumefaciens 5A]MDP9559688.1 flagellar hook-associated protein 3 FlgL [Rhizobium nepotum]QDG92258.1 flagellar hook-associated family protein [Rhizobium sp. NIBRBAC000502774]